MIDELPFTNRADERLIGDNMGTLRPAIGVWHYSVAGTIDGRQPHPATSQAHVVNTAKEPGEGSSIHAVLRLETMASTWA